MYLSQRFTRRALALAVACAVASPAVAQEVSWTAKLAQEVDSNPARLSGEGSTSDTATRVSISADGNHAPHTDWRLHGQAYAAARFYRRATGNDTALIDASATASWAPSQRWRAQTTLSGRDTAERDDGRDYRTLSASHGWRVGSRRAGLRVAIDGTHFLYKPDRSFEWHGWRTPLTFEARPVDALRLNVGGSVGRRFFPHRRLSPGEVRRVDRVYGMSGALTYGQGRVQFGLRWTSEWLGSNEDGKDFVRHTVSPSLSVVPAGDLLVRVSARVQRGRCLESCALIDEFERADEETRNRVSVVVEHPLGLEWLWGEARYQRFSQSFEGASEGDFLRHVGMLGVAVRR